jgi:hypothetical protein
MTPASERGGQGGVHRHEPRHAPSGRNGQRLSGLPGGLGCGSAALIALLAVACTGDASVVQTDDTAESAAGAEAAASALELPGYQALPDSVVDRPEFTHVERRLIVTDTVDAPVLEALLRAEFAAIMSSGQYAHRERPTHVYIRVYDSEVRSRRPALWRAMLRFGPGSDEPAIQTDNSVLKRQIDG